MRTENLRNLVVLCFLSVGFILIAAISSEACSCSGRPQGVKGVQTCGYYGRSEDIFIGLAETVEIDKEKGSMKVTFSVEKSIRGTNEKTVEVFTSADTATCGYPFKQGERYFVYGRKGTDGKYRESLCGPTTLLKDAEDDLDFARDIESGKLGTRIYGNVYEDRQLTLKDKRSAEPLSQVEITIKSKQNKFKTFTDEKGNYLFKDVPKDRYQVFARLPSGYRELFVRADLTEHFASGCDGNNFRVTRQGSLRGRVVNFPSKEIQNPWSGNNIAQPKVTLIPLDENGKPFKNYYYEEQWAYRDKFEYFFDRVPAGNYILAINPKNCPYPNNGVPPTFYPGVINQADAKIISIKDGENLVLGDFRSLPLLKERWFSGIVRFDDGRPAMNAAVSLLDGENGECSNGEGSKAVADEQGNFRLKGYEGYRYRLRAFTDRFHPRDVRDRYTTPIAMPTAGAVEGIELTLMPRKN
ncbi:MAG: hypothetical protein QM785_06320 [Pyrinomonadaceae bacterium]